MGRRLWRRPRCRQLATAAPSSLNHRHSDAFKRLCPAGKLADTYRDGHGHHRHERELERKRRSGRRRIERNNYVGWRVHRAERSTLARDCPGNSHEPGGLDEIRDSAAHRYERFNDCPYAAKCQRRARCHPTISSNNYQRRASGHFRALEPQRISVSRGMRNCRPQRQLHRAGNSSVHRNRDAHGARRCRPIEASDGCHQHHQPFHSSSYRPTKRARWRHGNDRRHDDAHRRLESQHDSSVVPFRPRLQLYRVWNPNDCYDTRIGGYRNRRYSDLHGPCRGAKSRQRYGHRNAPSRSHKSSASDNGRPGRRKRQPIPSY